VTDPEDCAPPAPGLQANSRQVDHVVIKARVRPAERDQIIAMAKSRRLSMSDFLREAALRETAKRSDEFPAGSVSDLVARVERLDAKLSSVFSIGQAEGNEPSASRAGRTPAAIDVPSENLELVLIEKDFKKLNNDAVANGPKQSPWTDLWREIFFVSTAMLLLLNFLVWLEFNR
jgi:hypothetical protein